MKKREDVVGVILAGGKSTRMGQDKALLDLNGKPFIQHIAAALQEVFQNVIIVSDHGEQYAFLGLPTYEDIFKNCGPLGGIHSAFARVTTESIFVVSCDVPLLSPQTVRYLTDARSDCDVTVAVEAKNAQPLCGLYHRTCFPVIEEHIKRGQRSVQVCLKDLRTVTVAPMVAEGADPSPILTNVNSPEEYDSILRNAPRTKTAMQE